MARFDVLLVHRLKFKLVFARLKPNVEIHSLADVYAVRILSEENNYSLLVLL